MAPGLAGDERLEATIARLDRHFMAPSTAAEWLDVESESDVLAVLPLLRCPTLVLDFEHSSSGAAESRHVQARIPGAERRQRVLVRRGEHELKGVPEPWHVFRVSAWGGVRDLGPFSP